MEEIISVKAQLAHSAYKTTLSNGRTEIIADEPPAKGGTDLGPTPHELLAMSLASCTAITLRMYTQTKNWDVGEITVQVDINREEGVATFNRNIQFTNLISEEMYKRILIIADKCPVHKTLSGVIKIKSEIVS